LESVKYQQIIFGQPNLSVAPSPVTYGSKKISCIGTDQAVSLMQNLGRAMQW